MGNYSFKLNEHPIIDSTFGGLILGAGIFQFGPEALQVTAAVGPGVGVGGAAPAPEE